jgi:hypothetical protein
VHYRLWSRGRLLGETDLGFIYRENGFRCGWFHPNELGERLMPDATGVAPAIRIDFIIGPDQTARADIRAAGDRQDALALELRRSDGVLIETEHIAIIDTEYLLSLPEPEIDLEGVELDAEILAELEELEEERAEHEIVSANEPETEWPRYQIQVQLIDADAVL